MSTRVTRHTFASRFAAVGFSIAMLLTIAGCPSGGDGGTGDGDAGKTTGDASADAGRDAAPGPGAQPVSMSWASDSSIILGEKGATAQLKVRVEYDDGGSLINPDGLAWDSDADGVVSVDDTGEVTAEADLGQAYVGAKFKDLGIIRASLLVAEPSDNTRLISSSAVKSRGDGDELTLKKPGAPDDLKRGQILVSGDRAGILSKVEKVETSGDDVVVTVSPSSLADAFVRLQAIHRGEPKKVDIAVGEAMETMPGQLVGRRQTLGASKLNCDKSAKKGGLTLTGPSFSASPEFDPIASLRIVDNEVQMFRLGVQASLTLEATAGEFGLDASFEGSYDCRAELGQIKTPGLGVGPVKVALALTPIVGVKGELELKGGKIRVAGPNGHIEFTSRFGTRYSPRGGWEDMSHLDRESEFEPFAFEKKFERTFSMSAEPYFQLDVGGIISLWAVFGNVELADLRFADARIYGRGEFSIGPPYDITDPKYVGPEWKLTYGADAHLKMELKDGVVKDIVDALGVPNSAPGKITLFEWQPKEPLAESPNFTPTANPSTVKRSRTIFNVDVGENFAGDKVKFIIDDGSSSTAGARQGFFNKVHKNGVGIAFWRPGRMDNGTYDINALVYDGFFGDVGLPYGSEKLGKVIVDIPKDSPLASSNPTISRFSCLGAVLKDGTIYDWDYDNRVKAPSNVKMVACDDDARGLLLTQDGTVWTWGTAVPSGYVGGTATVANSKRQWNETLHKLDTYLEWDSGNRKWIQTPLPKVREVAITDSGHSIVLTDKGKVIQWADSSTDPNQFRNSDYWRHTTTPHAVDSYFEDQNIKPPIVLDITSAENMVGVVTAQSLVYLWGCYLGASAKVCHHEPSEIDPGQSILQVEFDNESQNAIGVVTGDGRIGFGRLGRTDANGEQELKFPEAPADVVTMSNDMRLALLSDGRVIHVNNAVWNTGGQVYTPKLVQFSEDWARGSVAVATSGKYRGGYFDVLLGDDTVGVNSRGGRDKEAEFYKPK